MILLIADSVCGGFGQLDKKSFVHLAIEKINFEILDHSATGMTSSDYLDFLRTGIKVAKEQGDLYQKQTVFSHVIIALGNVDCKGTYFKNNLLAKIIPKRYRKEKLDPRPYYSKKKIKHAIQRIENLIRTIARLYLYRTKNLEPATPVATLKNNILKLIKKHENSKIILISPSQINEKLFPGTQARFDEFDMFLKEQVDSSVFYFDMRTPLTNDMLLEDYFHLNNKGHAFLSEKFSNLIKEL